MIWRNRYSWITAIGGLLILMGSIAAAARLIGEKEPGKLFVKDDLLTWRSPSGGALPTTDDTKTRFELRNLGGRPVKILGFTTSCGCASPTIEPTTILPGAVGRVEVRMAPFPTGEKTVSLTLQTDSPLTPEIELRLRAIGTRRPPYMLKAGGELSFLDSSTASSVREILVYTIETTGSEPKPPLVTTDLSILQIGKPILREEKPYVEPGTLAKLYSIEVTCLPTEEGEFAGDVTVTDPWDPQHSERLRVHGAVQPPMKAVPSRIILRSGEGPGDGGDPAEVLIQLKEPAKEIIAEVVDGDTAPFTVGTIRSLEEGRRFVVPIRPKAGDTRTGEWSVRIRREGPKSPGLTLPVAVRRGR